MAGHGQRVIGVVAVIDIGDAKFDFENCCRKGHVIVSTQVVRPEQAGRIQWSGRRARRQFESPPGTQPCSNRGVWRWRRR